MGEIRQLIASKEPDGSTERCWNWKADKLQIERTIANRGRRYNGYPVSAGYWGSYCIERCINFLGDSDSHGSIAGQIAGAIYGYRSLHPRFLEHPTRWDDNEVALRGVLLFQG